MERFDQLMRRAAADRGVVGLAGGLPAAAQFPRRALGRAFQRALDDPAALQYGWPEGSPKLRAWIAERLRRRGARTTADQVIVTSGAQQAIAIAVGLTCRSGAAVTTAAETYPAALDLFRTRRLRASVAAAPVAYAMPEVDNPRGQRLDGGARARLLAEHRLVIEGDAYADLRFDGPPGRPLLADAPDRVLHVGTLSKSLSPGLRIGWLVVPPRMHERALAAKHAGDLQPSSLAQAVVEAYLGEVDWDARLALLRRLYQRRARRLGRALTRELPGWRWCAPGGGFAIWVESDAALPELTLLEAALHAGVSFDPGSLFRPDGAPAPLALRLCYSAVADEAELESGVRRLALAWRTVT